MEEHRTLELVRCLAFVEAGLARRRKAGLEYHSIMNIDRSIRPTSRSALAKWLSFGDAESFFRIVEGTTNRVEIEVARWSRSFQWSRINAMSIDAPMWLVSAE